LPHSAQIRRTLAKTKKQKPNLRIGKTPHFQ
jgi:hypothetical protein